MRHIFQVGPVESDEGPFSLCVSFGPEGLDVEPCSELAAGLDALLSRGSAKDSRCEPTLAALARSRGVTVAELDEPAMAAKAALSVSLIHGELLGELNDLPLLLELIHASADFVEAAPWEKFSSEQAIVIEVSGARTGRFEGSVLGAGGDEHGLVLYLQPGSIQKVVALEAQDRLNEAHSLDSVAALFTDEGFAAQAIEQLCEVCVCPELIRMQGGELVPLSGTDLACLVAALRAVVRLASDDPGPACGQAGGGSTQVQARAIAPAA